MRLVLESFQLLCETSPDWLCENIGYVLGIVSMYMQYGLPNWVPAKPTRLFPTPGSQWEPQPPALPRVSVTNNSVCVCARKKPM